MNPRNHLLAPLVLSLPLVGCGEDDSSRAAREPLSFVTFNAGLLAQSQNVEQRMQRIAQDLPSLDADVICLQEVWQPEHVQTITSAVKADYPHAHWSVTAASGSSNCTQTESDLLIGCISAKCPGIEASGMALCAVANCANEYAAVSAGCQQCVLANQTQPPTTIAATCTATGSGSTAYSNQNGLVLLSKHEFIAKDFQALESSFGDRGVLYAQIESSLLPGLHLFCTHLAATLSGVTYPGPHGTWAGERTVQIHALTAYAKSKQQSGTTTVALGDMNTGPTLGSVVGEDPECFTQLDAAGLKAPYLSSSTARCTFCSDNTIIDSTSGVDVLIDHVLFSNLPKNTTTQAKRVFDDPIRLDVAGSAVDTFRSDHYGLMVTAHPKP